MRRSDIYPVKTVYYKDERNDEFSDARIKARPVDDTYPYLSQSPLWPLGRFLAYRLFATPLAFLYTKLILGYRVKGRRVLRGMRGRGYSLFANHTQPTGDAFMPHVAMFPKSAYTVVHPANISMPVLGRITPFLGAIPTPDGHRGIRPFRHAIETRIRQGHAVILYPEAHIWPYYTGIRPFAATSMSFPADLGVASFTMTTTYQRRRFFKKPRAVSYIDGPFYPDESLPPRERAKDLRDRMHRVMTERARLSNCEYIRYIKEDTTN